jgi:hypothetical protein
MLRIRQISTVILWPVSIVVIIPVVPPVVATRAQPMKVDTWIVVQGALVRTVMTVSRHVTFAAYDRLNSTSCIL